MNNQTFGLPMGEDLFILWPLIVGVAFSLLLVKALINTYQGKSLLARRKRCNACAHVGRTIVHTPGSLLVELLLWGLAGLGGILVILFIEKIGMFALLFLLLAAPSPIYSNMRMAARLTVCAKCGSSDFSS